MNSELSFFMEIEPPKTTAQEKKICVVGGRPRFYEPAKLKAAKLQLMEELKKFAPKEPFRGALSLRCTWIFTSKNLAKSELYEYRVTRPDTDNLQKLLKDCMTKTGFWKDDSQVVIELCTKINTRGKSGIIITVEEIKRESAFKPMHEQAAMRFAAEFLSDNRAKRGQYDFFGSER